MTMMRWQGTIAWADEAGRMTVLPGAEVEVRAETPGRPLVQLYGDREGAEPLGNPITADESGYVFFHAVGGAYQFTVTHASESRVFNFERIGLMQEADGLVTGTQRVATEAGDVTVSVQDIRIEIDKDTPENTDIVLPPIENKVGAVTIVDRGRQAGTFTFTITPDGTDKILGLDEWLMTQPGQALTLNAPIGAQAGDSWYIT